MAQITAKTDTRVRIEIKYEFLSNDPGNIDNAGVVVYNNIIRC